MGTNTFASILSMAPDQSKTVGLAGRMMIVVSKKYSSMEEW
jgi:hypothetical protein